MVKVKAVIIRIDYKVKKKERTQFFLNKEFDFMFIR